MRGSSDRPVRNTDPHLAQRRASPYECLTKTVVAPQSRMKSAGFCRTRTMQRTSYPPSNALRTTYDRVTLFGVVGSRDAETRRTCVPVPPTTRMLRLETFFSPTAGSKASGEATSPTIRTDAVFSEILLRFRRALFLGPRSSLTHPAQGSPHYPGI